MSERTRAPIAWQIMGLLVAVLVLSQAMTFAVIVFAPPPKQNFYRIDEVAAALRGEAVTPRDGRPLHRAFADARPAAPPGSDRFRTEGFRRAIADSLAVPETSVVLFQQPPSLLSRFPAARSPQRPSQPQRRPNFRGGLPPRLRPDAPPGARAAFRLGPIGGGFTAAILRPDKRWLVVTPEPAPFPTDWQKQMAFWLFGSLLIAIPAGYLFGRRITAPLRAFAQAADTLGRDPNAPQMRLSGPAEVGAAARAFNEMQARLKRYVADRTAMVGAISHDLRTPLARIRFKLEGAPADLKASVVKDVEQMEQMIAAVLTFIRDASEPRLRERLDLLSLIECVVDDAALAGAAVTLEDGRPVIVDADALALQRLFSNLVDNAVKHADRAHIRLSEQAGEAVVEIADEGPGLADGELERVFTPFYRASAARNLDSGGVGLGLAIARSIARAHGGDVTLTRTAGGLTATVRLPLTAEAPKAQPKAKPALTPSSNPA